MLARISTTFVCTAEQLWVEISQQASLRFVAALFLYFKPLFPGDLNSEWVLSKAYPLRRWPSCRWPFIPPTLTMLTRERCVSMETLSKFNLPCTLFAHSLVFGFWLSYAGKPYNGWLFNIHKLIALAAVIVTANQMIKLLRSMESQTIVIVLLIVAALCVIVLFASGALMSAGKLEYALMLTFHGVAPVLLAIGLGLGQLLIKSSS